MNISHINKCILEDMEKYFCEANNCVVKYFEDEYFIRSYCLYNHCGIMIMKGNNEHNNHFYAIYPLVRNVDNTWQIVDEDSASSMYTFADTKSEFTFCVLEALHEFNNGKSKS